MVNNATAASEHKLKAVATVILSSLQNSLVRSRPTHPPHFADPPHSPPSPRPPDHTAYATTDRRLAANRRLTHRRAPHSLSLCTQVRSLWLKVDRWIASADTERLAAVSLGVVGEGGVRRWW